MTICFHPIGWVRTDDPEEATPHFYSASDMEGALEILPEYEPGLTDIKAGQRIVVLFYFDRSPTFELSALRQVPRKRNKLRGVFSICSPKRPNAIGMSIVKVLSVSGSTIRVKGIDMFDGTPILDIKPVATPPGKE